MTAELYRLLELGEYQSCLVQGRQILEASPLDVTERAQILAVLCRCHLALEELPAAIQAGSAAASAARKARLRDLEGSTLLDLAMAQTRYRRYGAALTALDRFRRNLHRYTASAMLEGAALDLTGQVLCLLNRPSEAVDWFQQAFQWYGRSGQLESAGKALLCSLEACLAVGSPTTARQFLERTVTPVMTGSLRGRLLLVRAQLQRMAGRVQEAVFEAFQALEAAEPQSGLQVEAQLYLSRIAAETERRVEALSFALAARVTAIDGRLYHLESEAAAHFARLVRRFGGAAVAELAAELAQQGVDLYEYVDPGVISQLLQGEG